MSTGSAAFFAPLTVSSPASGLPPCTIIVSTDLLNEGAPATCSRKYNAISTAIILVHLSIPVSRAISEECRYHRAHRRADLDSHRAVLAQISGGLCSDSAVEIEPVNPSVECRARLPAAYFSIQLGNLVARNVGRIRYD